MNVLCRKVTVIFHSGMRQRVSFTKVTILGETTNNATLIFNRAGDTVPKRSTAHDTSLCRCGIMCRCVPHHRAHERAIQGGIRTDSLLRSAGFGCLRNSACYRTLFCRAHAVLLPSRGAAQKTPNRSVCRHQFRVPSPSMRS